MTIESETSKRSTKSTNEASNLFLALFRNLRIVFLGGGIALLLMAWSVAENAGPMKQAVMGGLACGLAIAGGLCFIAVALLHPRE
ncbi:MAG: hypothetical protein R3C12_16565 [Planctomycetaceae bacterium]|nr:hypothetical protein [Planctomycetaceae bacterium]